MTKASGVSESRESRSLGSLGSLGVSNCKLYYSQKYIYVEKRKQKKNLKKKKNWKKCKKKFKKFEKSLKIFRKQNSEKNLKKRGKAKLSKNMTERQRLILYYNQRNHFFYHCRYDPGHFDSGAYPGSMITGYQDPPLYSHSQFPLRHPRFQDFFGQTPSCLKFYMKKQINVS